ncbi:MAG: glycosyltransferase family 2 protein [Archaeoglobaceae archaeon]|nr:glycosyltransferase family 2 protein [Archaeoglobaceae archaeon]
MMISIVFPAYNEAERIEKAIKETEKFLKEINYDYEIIVAEDGSTDGTDKIVQELVNDKIRLFHSDVRLGRGKALMNAFEKAKGEIVISMDVDLATNIKHLKELIEAIENGYDIAIGSRLIEGSKAKRSFERLLYSKVYNFLVRALLKSKIKDHQCGFKAFKKDIVVKLGKEAKDNHWFWDTEILVLAQRKGYKIKEIPVEWIEGKDTKVRRTDVFYMFSRILKMWLRLIGGK